MKLKLPLRGLAPLEVVDPAVVRAFVRVAAACCGLGVALMAVVHGLGLGQVRPLAAAGVLALGVLYLLLDRVPPGAAQARGLAAVLCLTTLLLLSLAWLRGEGVFAPGLAVMPLVACSAGVLLGMRAALAVGGLAVLGVAALLPVSGSLQLAQPALVLSAQGRAVALVFHLVCALAVAFVAGRVMRRLLERARSSESRQREVFARSPLALMIHRDGRLMVANDSLARLFGYSSAQAMEGMSILDLYDPSEHARVLERHARAKQQPIGERLPLAEFKGRRADGSAVRLRGAAAPIQLSDGPALEALYVEPDSMGDSERALLKSDAMLSRLFVSSPVCVMVTDLASGQLLMVNPGCERLTGYPAGEALGRTPLQLQLWADPAHRERYMRAIQAHGSVLDMPALLRARDGSVRSISLSGSTFDFEGRRCLVSQMNDVTQIETERREVAAILDNASVGIALTVGARFVRVNRRLEEMLGWEPGTLAGQSTRSIWPSDRSHRHSVEPVNTLFDAARTIDITSELYRRDGSALMCHTRGVVLDHGPGNAGGRGGLVWIMEDVTERHRIARELELARDAAEAGSRAKSAFLANMSHEIRTPLHGVMGLAELASRRDLAPAQRDAYLAQLIESGRALTHVISEVLDLSKIEAGQMALELRHFDLHELARSVCSLYSPDAQTRGIALRLDIEPDVPRWVQGDAVRVRQILVNFSSNAMKFTERGSVKLRLGMVGSGRILLSVRDTGPGLDAWTRERLFTPFMQADESTTRRFGGTGLGLSICRQLAQLMGGEVGVSSEVGQGSEFWAALPLPPGQAPQQPAVPEATPSALAALETLQGARVLVVEDNPVNMMIVTAQLQQWGVQVLQAGDGVEALEVLQCEPRGSIDLVLMDLQMPRMGGEQAVRKLRESRGAQELPVVALTAAALVEEQERALQAGFNDFVTKPMDSQRLREILQRWVVAAEAERAV
jgi:PAS domain S-box-containing protein